MQRIPFIDLFKSALHVSGDKLVHYQEYFFDRICSFWYNAPIFAVDRCIVSKAVYKSKSAPGIYSFWYNAPTFVVDRCIVPKAVYTVKKCSWYIQLLVQCTDICCRPVHCTKSCIYSQDVYS